MLDNKDDHVEQPKSLSLQPWEPEGAKHITSFLEKEATRSAPSEQKKPFEPVVTAKQSSPVLTRDVAPQVQTIEEKSDMISEVDLSMGAFNPRRDPFSIDFEKIAGERAAKQYQFQKKEGDEQNPWDVVHGGRFTYKGEQMEEDKEMHDFKGHAALD